MATRIVVFQVPDTQTEDDINMAIARWNEAQKDEDDPDWVDRPIKYHKASFIVATPEQLRV